MISQDTKRKLKAKVVFVGLEYSGKTAIIKRLVEHRFSETGESTVGAYVIKYVKDLPNCHVKLSIWDTAGQEKYKALIQNYYRDARAIILVYDITKRHSFDEAKVLMDEIKATVSADVIIALDGNKLDLEEVREVAEEEGEELAKANNAFFIETSAKTGANIEEMLDRVCVELERLPPEENSDEDNIVAVVDEPRSCCKK